MTLSDSSINSLLAALLAIESAIFPAPALKPAPKAAPKVIAIAALCASKSDFNSSPPKPPKPRAPAVPTPPSIAPAAADRLIKLAPRATAIFGKKTVASPRGSDNSPNNSAVKAKVLSKRPLTLERASLRVISSFLRRYMIFAASSLIGRSNLSSSSIPNFSLASSGDNLRILES